MGKKITNIKVDPKPAEDSPEALASLADKYEDVLEAQIKALYMRMITFVSASQLPLVHVNTVLDLIKYDLLEQLHKGYWEKD